MRLYKPQFLKGAILKGGKKKKGVLNPNPNKRGPIIERINVKEGGPEINSNPGFMGEKGPLLKRPNLISCKPQEPKGVKKRPNRLEPY